MRSKLMAYTLLALMTHLLWSSRPEAAVYPQPPAVSAFTTTGFIQVATLDTPTDVLSGGTVTVNGTLITIPRNTIVVMSATNLTWQELFAFAPCPWGLTSTIPNSICPTGNGETGLALNDSPPPLTTYEITILGNRVGNGGTGNPDYVAGLVYMAQQSLNVGQGVINFIDYSTGELYVGGPMGGKSGARVQINDPVGRFGRVLSPDPRFTADTDNPTIRSKTGYPMCIPRTTPPAAILAGQPLPAGYAETDALCPQVNRPLDPAVPTAPLGNFTLGPIANTPPPPPVGVARNAVATAIPPGHPDQQAPFMMGDAIEYSGTLQEDGHGQYISAFQIVANVGIYTSPDTVPAYLAQELLLIGTGGTPITAPLPVPQEVTTRIKTRGFFTDPTRTVDLFAVVPDPCTGVETEVLMLGAIPNQNGGVPWGRFRDVDLFGAFPLTRQWRVRYTPIFTDPGFPGHPNLIAANGLDTLTYTAPVTTFITPENLVYGDPTLLVVPQNFQDIPFLAKGEGPWRGDLTHIVGQLTPFPLTNSIPGLTPGVPPTASCPPNQAPIAKITPPNQTVASTTKVTLNASASMSPLGHVLTYTWLQTSGPSVALTPGATSTSPTATFTAPNVRANTGLTFQVTVTDNVAVPPLSSTASTLVVVTPGKLPADTVTIAAGGIVYRKNRGVLNATATSSDTTCSAILTLTAVATNLGVVTMIPGTPVAGAPCTYTFISGKTVTPAPTSVLVQSSLGGSNTATLANGELVIKP